MLRTLARDFGFRLTRLPAGFRRRRGLLTLSEAVIPGSRIEAALIQSGMISGRLGWHKLSFQTLGAESKARGLQVAAPFARAEEIADILRLAGLPAPPAAERFVAAPRRAMLRAALPWLLLAIPAAWIGALIAFQGYGSSLLFLGLAGLTVLRWRRRGYYLGEEAIFARTGCFGKRIWIVRFERLQALAHSAGPVQRRLRLASLMIDSAGAPANGAPALVDLDAGVAQQLAARLLALAEAARGARRSAVA